MLHQIGHITFLNDLWTLTSIGNFNTVIISQTWEITLHEPSYFRVAFKPQCNANIWQTYSETLEGVRFSGWLLLLKYGYLGLVDIYFWITILCKYSKSQT
jgi:hypothetical protein